MDIRPKHQGNHDHQTQDVSDDDQDAVRKDIGNGFNVGLVDIVATSVVERLRRPRVFLADVQIGVALARFQRDRKVGGVRNIRLKVVERIVVTSFNVNVSLFSIVYEFLELKCLTYFGLHII